MKRTFSAMAALAGLSALVIGVNGTHHTVGRAAAPSVGVSFSPTDETKVPHYFGPFPNWANSPQVLADAIVSIVGGGGAGAEATATVDPKTGGIASIDVTSPGSGYTAVPSVVFSSPGVTPTSNAQGLAHVSSGVVTAVNVAESGFGFSAPTIDFTGGNPDPGFTATAVASGEVDNLSIISGGSGYTTKPIVRISMPDLADGRQATATATMNSRGIVDGVTIVDGGSGYLSAPTIDILDGNKVNPTGADIGATIGVTRIDVTAGGRGYDTPPTVLVTDTIGAADKGASATATIARRGAVTSVTVVNPGSGYLTPGLKKFVDTLPGTGPENANNYGQYIPEAVKDTTTYPGSDYYEIAVVQYRQQFSSQLPASLLRGYVQLSTAAVPGRRVPLTNANLDPTKPATPITLNGAQVYGVDSPHYLGPVVVAEKDKPVRILFRNLLPAGTGGDLFLPTDTTLMGAGMGPNMINLQPDGVPMDMATDQGTVVDDVRNPVCEQTPKPSGCFTENRATIHLHGGITPWISDGTPHQWITPATENTPYPKGVSVSNVPDMPDPGPGAETFFYTNQQSARLMWYHDHSWGITRLNVYAGEAAPYLLTDNMEKQLTGTGGALAGLGGGTPLIIQDKTFVPSDTVMASHDPTWNYAKWGGYGNLWVPHVYMPAQNPGSKTGASVFGRWMYGPWFWPPAKDAKYPPIANPYFDKNCNPDVQPFCEPPLIPSTPNVSVGMEAFNDTPIVNGTAYPTTTVDPKSYRYRILNAANDRFWNLSWYVADPTTGTLSEVAFNPAELAAAQTDPIVVPTPDTSKSPAGPDWIQIGTEGGFLPAPVVVPAQPTTWITDPTRFDFGNVDKHSLLLAPAERADVIVDFSQYRGKTLILYNDAPAAFPARQASMDYYTGNPDMGPAGAPSTLPGYGPNTRTVMQVKVSMATPDVRFDRPNTTNDRLGALVTAFAHHSDGSGVFESSQDPIIVGQAAYNSAYGTSFIENGWCSSPTAATAKCDGYARVQEQTVPGGVAPNAFKFDTLSGTQLQVAFQPKGMHDEMNSASFDEWGRMTANIGVEAPGATPLLQNIILYPYVNPPTEVLNATSSALPSSLNVTRITTNTDGTQIWKITHNGVDTHPIHFHLYDVQLINRVTWDGIIIPPEPTEIGWKDTVRVSPLEDTLVAVRPIIPSLPFAVPDSYRPLNPMMPIGARGDLNTPTGLGYEAGFNNTDTAGNPMATPIINTIYDFGWEYAIHCHILSHEEMDMMRPESVFVARALADAPTLSQVGTTNEFNWTDGTLVDYLDPRATGKTWGNDKAEIGYRIERADVAGGQMSAFATIAHAVANTTVFMDTTATMGSSYEYRVTAYNAAGDSPSNIVPVTYSPAALTGVVSGPIGVLRAGVTVSAYTPAGANVASDVTAADGSYSLNLLPGKYQLFVSPNITGYQNQWYKSTGNVPLATAADIVNVVAPTTTTNIALVGIPKLTLNGKVRLLAVNGVAVAGARVAAYDAGTQRSVATSQSDASGNFLLSLVPGNYKLYITSNTPGYANQWWGAGTFGTGLMVNATVIALTVDTAQNIILHL
jgi:FtsP/CotA-like multicopper oxidase with cupredoxin domain